MLFDQFLIHFGVVLRYSVPKRVPLGSQIGQFWVSCRVWGRHSGSRSAQGGLQTLPGAKTVFKRVPKREPKGSQNGSTIDQILIPKFSQKRVSISKQFWFPKWSKSYQTIQQNRLEIAAEISIIFVSTCYWLVDEICMTQRSKLFKMRWFLHVFFGNRNSCFEQKIT